MMMKKILIPGLLMLTLLACDHKNKVEIKGEIKDAVKQTVYLEKVNIDHVIVTDSAQINKKGRFSFKTAVTTPTFYNIRIGKNENVTVIAEPETTIELSGNFEDLKNNYWVDGSENSLWIKLLNFQLNNTKIVMDSLKKAYATLPEEETFAAERQQITAAWDSVILKQVSFSRDFILKHAISLAAYYALYQKIDNENFILTPEDDLHSFKIVASSMKAMYPDSPYTLAILRHLDQIGKNIQSQKMRNLIANAESNLPQINLPGINGELVSLHALQGKYILLDFSVLGTKDSRVYIEELKTIYNKFHGRGLEIYQVCLDPNKLLWEDCVKEYGITWKCVRDAEALGSKAAKHWNIQTVPANYIINKQFDIVGKNLNGRRLEDRLNDIMR